MTTKPSWAVVTLCVSALGCSPMGSDPTLDIAASPRVIRNDGQVSTITITAVDEKGQPGTGSVRVRSTAGDLKAGTAVNLSGGKAEASFSCAVATDPDCRQSVRITAEWTTSQMKLAEGTVSITITTPVPDAGAGGGTAGGASGGGAAGGGSAGDGGVDDGGSPDAGPDAGMPLPPMTFDGGYSGLYRLSVVNIEKPTLLTGVMDELDITFELTTNTTGMLPVANRPATISVDRGAWLDLASMSPTATRMTGANGQFTVTVSSGNVSRGIVNVVATANDAQITARFGAVNVAIAEWLSDPQTRTTLAVTSTGMGTTSPVFFRVLDPNNVPVQGVEVEFSIAPNSAAGCTVVPARDTSNAMGVVTTRLTAGDSQGTATVIARVVGLPDTPSTNFNIVIGRVNEGRMQLSCSRSSLGALQSPTPPRNDQNTPCTVTLADRNGRNPPFSLNVSWLSEAGNLPTMTTSAAGASSVSASFNSGGNLPVATSPLAAAGPPFPSPPEPSNGAANPRDGFVSIVAAVQGEEEFWDGSGSSQGLSNGTWDRGEYWVDLAEPFADSNDNGVWDPGEPFIDTDRTNCATGQPEPKNNRWDPPNGCWDRNTQVWKTTHIVYTGNPASGPGLTPTYLRFTPAIPAVVQPNTLAQVDVAWTDGNFNRFASDSASINVFSIAGTRGTATISNTTISGEAFGHQLEYVAVRAHVSDAGQVLAEEGDCNPQEPDAGYPAIRCLRSYKFRNWRTTQPSVTLNIVGPSPQAALPDGGQPPPTFATWELRATNGLQSGPSSYQFTVQFP